MHRKQKVWQEKSITWGKTATDRGSLFQKSKKEYKYKKVCGKKHGEKLSRNWNALKMVSVFKCFYVCVLQRLNLISSTLVNTNINLQLSYYIFIIFRGYRA